MKPGATTMRPALHIDRSDALLDHREREAAVELEHVVRHAGRDVADSPERAAALLLDREGRRARTRRRRPLRPRGAPRPGSSRTAPRGTAAVEADDQAVAGPLRAPPRSPARPPTQTRAPGGEACGIVARVLDDEGAVEAVRPADAADRRPTRQARSTISRSARSLRRPPLARTRVRSARAIRPWRPMTLPTSSGAT